MKTLFTKSITLIFILLGNFSVNQVQAQEPITAQQWQEDLRFLQKTVHTDYPFLFKKISAQDFDAEVEKLHKEIPTLEAHELPIAMARMVSLFKYGHTQIPYSTLAKNGVLPVNLYHFNDGIYIEGVQKGHEKTLGAKVVKVGGKPVAEALRLIKPVVPVENEQYFKAYGLRFLTVPEVLHAQKVLPNLSDKVTLTLEKEGKVFEYTFPTIPRKELSKGYTLTKPNENWLSVRQNGDTPLYLKYLHDKFYYFEYLENDKTLYVRQSSVFNDESETLKDFYNRLFEFIDSNEVDKLIYDVRLNGGGNNYNNLQLIKGLMARPSINKQGKFFYIIGRNTFSACQNLTNEIGRYTEAIMIGEPTSENVNFYGDTKPVVLPNSNITAYLSFAWWQDLPPWENNDATYPNITVDMSFEEYKTNQDPVLKVAMEYTGGDFIIDPMGHLTKLFIAQDFATFEKDMKAMVNDKRYSGIDFQGQTNRIANRLADQGNGPGAGYLLELNTRLFPDSASTWLNLARFMIKTKKPEKAKQLLAKASALHPTKDEALAIGMLLAKIK